jgi:uncharacterized BrkB/YihY/UPF0761 family membrane protein
VRSAAAAATGLRTRAQVRLELERERRFVVALGFAAADRSRRTAASVLAGALAFRFFVTLLPLTLVLVVGLGYLKSAGGKPSDVAGQFGIRGVLASTVNHSASFSDPGRTVVLLLGLVALVSACRTTVATLRAVHAIAWDIPVVRWRKGGRAAMVLLAGVVVTFAFAGIAVRVRSEGGAVLGGAASVLIAAVVTAIWLGASWLLPHREVEGWLPFLPGAILVGVGVALLQVISLNFVGPRLEHKSALYGTLGTSFVLLGWLYVLGRLLVAAPLLNALLVEHRRAPGGVPADGRGA